jgi:hypothetical protein
MLSAMTQLLSQIAQPVNQAEYQQGQMDGARYYGEGHSELIDKYESGTRDYRLGFDVSKESPRAMDPDYAS